MCVKERSYDLKVTSLKEEDFFNAIGPDWRTSLGEGRRRQRWKNVRCIPCLIGRWESNMKSAKCPLGTCVILYQAGVGNAMIFSCAQLFGYNDMSFFSRWVFHHDAKWESGIFCYGTIPFIHLMFFLTQATTYEAGFQWLGCSGQFERSTLGNLLGSGPGCSCSLQILPNNLIQPICIRTFIYA